MQALLWDAELFRNHRSLSSNFCKFAFYVGVAQLKANFLTQFVGFFSLDSGLEDFSYPLKENNMSSLKRPLIINDSEDDRIFNPKLGRDSNPVKSTEDRAEAENKSLLERKAVRRRSTPSPGEDRLVPDSQASESSPSQKGQGPNKPQPPRKTLPPRKSISDLQKRPHIDVLL